ncbi:efflux RND transporter periplasmic adaptor subunit, partial [bacterium]|nr:efflux RND transporter periplasmic adaptor subunit [bacterium]
IEIRSKAGGTVRRIFVEEGDRVNPGDNLMEISPEASPAEQIRTREELRQAEVDLDKKQDELDISRELWEKKLLPERDFLNAQHAYDAALARYSAARAEWDLLRQKEGKDAYQAKGVDLNDEIHQMVRTSTIVRAPIAGLILSRNVDEGSSVTPVSSASGGTVVMTLGDDSELEFRGDVDEADMGKLRVGIPVQITVQSYPDSVFEGTLSHISPVGKINADQNQTTFAVRATVEDPHHILRVGMSTNARIVVEERTDILLLDETALIYEDRDAFVKLVLDSAKQETEKCTVKLGISNGIKTEITEGLKEGDKVLTGTFEEKDR